ncbi:MAG: DUF1343 domain-containing protein [Rhodothermales bacterium]|nr:DUF1343 domain-containing protein [Rhodothermales bacterium]MBO6779468.1 DUF1343 domain-containing protein [Rhodothermales bacterium]
MRILPVLVVLLLAACSGTGDGQSAPTQDREAVRTGAEVLAAQSFELLAGKRVGLIANQTSRAGREHLADLLAAAPDVELAALFGPEHGLRGDADAGLAVADGIDDATGTPVFSLYGERRAPDPEVLRSLDVLVFDIQDIGARFYTYIATMGLAMEAAAREGVPFVVLDRPNPLGGALVDGFVLEPEHESFVGPFPIPVQHGMTVGELARMAAGEGWIEGADVLDLTVVGVEGWSREMLWPETGLEWIPTSPNIPDFETALVYPGMCFFEATSLNEGRGTEAPFLLFGAPGLSGDAVIAGLEPSGVSLNPAVYVPVSMPGRAASPRHQDEEVSGVQVEVLDPSAVRPLALGMQTLAAAVAVTGLEVLNSRWMTRLAGTERLESMLREGLSGDAIVASWDSEVASFRQQRAPYLLYD